MDIPNVPGVPPLAAYALNEPALLFTDAISALLSAAGLSLWGVYLNGLPVFPMANSTVSFEFKQDWNIGTYPVEDGGFQSYDKVNLPYDVKVKIASGGSPIERQALLMAVDAASRTLDLYDVVTPERIYQSCNIMRYDYRRSASNGVGMIVFDIWFQEIRVTSSATFTNTAQPGEAGQTGVGNVRPETPSADVTNRLSAVGGPT